MSRIKILRTGSVAVASLTAALLASLAGHAEAQPGAARSGPARPAVAKATVSTVALPTAALPKAALPTVAGVHDGIGFFDPTNDTWHLRNDATVPGPSTYAVRYGNGANLQPLVGDWDGDGKDGIGYYDPATQTMHLRDDATRGATSNYAYRYVIPAGGHVIAGDWIGQGRDGIGDVDPNGTVHLRNHATVAGPSNYVLTPAGLSPSFSGDWTGAGRDGLAAAVDADLDTPTGFLGVRIQLHDRATAPSPISDDYFLHYGTTPARTVVAGDWTSTGRDGLGVYLFDRTLHLRTDARNATAGSSYAYPFGPAGYDIIPIAGRWV